MTELAPDNDPGDSLERPSQDIAGGPLNLHEYEAAARAALPVSVYDYIARGAGDEVTLRSNRLAFDRWRLLPRVLRGGTATLGTTVLGQPVSMPILVAPMTSQRIPHPEGELASGARWDAAWRASSRWRSSRHWIGLTSNGSRRSVPCLSYPRAFCHPEDARIAIEMGARAVIVSNHGGRQLDDVVPTLDALPAVARAAEGRAEILVDGGIRRGTDVLKALALGARAVLLGRPVYWVWPLPVRPELRGCCN